MARALRSSDTLHYARLDYNFEIARYRLQLRDFLPDITVGYSRDDAVAYYAPDSHLRKISVGVSQLLYIGGARIHERRALADRLQIRQHGIVELEKELRLEMVNRYVEILKLGLQIGILEESLARGKDQLVIAGEEMRLGEITDLDYIDIELAVQDLEIELAVMKQEEDILAFELKDLLDLEPTITIELTGVINRQFRGMLEVQDPRFYLSYARQNSPDFKQGAAEVAFRRGELQQARRSFLPRVTANLELSVSGEAFPLSEPGYSLGVNLDFSTPIAPLQAGFTTGGRAGEDRSLGMSSTAALAENLAARQTFRSARIGVHKAETEMEELRQNLDHAILHLLERRLNVLDSLRLEERRLVLQERRRTIEALMLEVGEITRLRYLQNGIELARQQVEQISRVVALFQLEAALLARCGLELLDNCHHHIVAPETDVPPW